jgi:hypothetical protein
VRDESYRKKWEMDTDGFRAWLQIPVSFQSRSIILTGSKITRHLYALLPSAALLPFLSFFTCFSSSIHLSVYFFSISS